MLALLFTLTAELATPIPSAFDLADMSAPAADDGPRRDLSARYLLPELDEPDEESGGIKVKVKWRRVRLTVPIEKLQPPF